MRSLASLFIRLITVTGAFCLCFIMVSAIVAPPVAVQTPLKMAMDDTPVWTEHPVRVDRSVLHIEPMRDMFPYRFRATAMTQVHDGGSFSVADGVMVLEDIVAPQPRAICTDAQGRKNACGARARAELRKLMAGKYIECRRNLLTSGVWLANCHINGRSLSQTMLDKAAATAVHRVMPPR